jgi:hypothetical protein
MRLTGWKAGLARASVPLLLLAAIGLAVAGHGSGGQASAASPCLSAATRIARPVDLPARFPVPRGTIFQARSSRLGAAIVEARVPGTLRGVRDFYRAELPRAAYRLGRGDAERYEAETDFSGHGLAGHLRLNALPGCPRVVALAVAVRPT